MHCPVCHTENAGTAQSCSRCGNSLSSPPAESPQAPNQSGKQRPSRRRGLAEESDSPFSDRGEGTNRTAIMAYRLSVYGILPGVGLFLGPIAFLMGCLARWRGRQDPDFRSHNLALAAVCLGLAVMLTQWGGLALMIWGWWGQ